MPQSLAQMYVHLVFSTKDRQPDIYPETGPRLHAYLAGILQAAQCPAVQIGGVADHVHILFRLSKNRALAEIVRDVKIESSKWTKSEGRVGSFAWQGGYAAFSVSASQLETVAAYIRNQAEHHRVRTFQEELREWLDRYQVTYDEAYLWD